MTPSTSLTFEGFLRGLQAEAMGLIGCIILIIIVLILARWFISKLLKGDEIDTTQATAARKVVGGIAAFLLLVALVGFSVSAATYATNVIPHSDLDKTDVYDQMKSNIQKP